MKKSVVLLLLAGVAPLLGTVASASTTIHLAEATGISFQNEGTLYADHTSLLAALDGVWAPAPSGTVH